MFLHSDIWRMLAGVAFFLLAMNFMENSLRLLAGRKFKIYLKKQTDNKVKAIGGGALVTGLLQSSSIVNLLVLSMVGASVLKMDNALAIMLGSNLGTTLNSWVLATIGFNYDIETLVLPMAGIAGIFMAFVNPESKRFLLFRFLFSLALLFVALGFIKTGMDELVKQTDLSAYINYPLIVFLLVGVLLTTIVQSSSVVIALTLSALHSNGITLLVATTIALGSEIGTTFKLFLASAQGLAIKKRVALGNFLFNLVTVIIMFFWLQPVNHLITDILHIKDKLIALVFFQSFVNLCCIIMFFPFLKVFGIFLMNRFSNSRNENIFAVKGPITDSNLALEELENGARSFIFKVIDYSLDSFYIKGSLNNNVVVPRDFGQNSIAGKYMLIKQAHGEMQGFYLKLLQEVFDKKEVERLNQLISSLRNSMYAAKNIRDAQHDIEQMRNSSNDTKYLFYTESKERLSAFYDSLVKVICTRTGVNQQNELASVYQSITTGYTDTLHQLYKEGLVKKVSELEISTLINFNRELYTSFKSILFAVKDYLLTSSEAERFDQLPGFIR